MSFGRRLGIIFLVVVAAQVSSRSTGYTEKISTAAKQFAWS